LGEGNGRSNGEGNGRSNGNGNGRSNGNYPIQAKEAWMGHPHHYWF
jgi:hypothetical protein